MGMEVLRRAETLLGDSMTDEFIGVVEFQAAYFTVSRI